MAWQHKFILHFGNNIFLTLCSPASLAQLSSLVQEPIVVCSAAVAAGVRIAVRTSRVAGSATAIAAPKRAAILTQLLGLLLFMWLLLLATARSPCLVCVLWLPLHVFL
ncbi:hypothetical protein ACP70R_041318 [Stipagrostis hirtigluma subsp. patula]